MKKLFDASMWKFLLVGVANTLLSAVIMFLLEGLGYWPSTAIAYVAGSVLSFFLNRRFTFQSKAPFWPSVLRFAINVAVCYVIAYSLAQPLAELILVGGDSVDLTLSWPEDSNVTCLRAFLLNGDTLTPLAEAWRNT